MVKVHCQAAFIAARTGMFGDAARELDAAEQLLEYAEPHERFGILLNGGNLRMLRGELAVARRQFVRAIDYAREQDHPSEVFTALHNLGYAEFLAGRLPDAIRAMDEAGELTVEISRGVWLLDRARVLGEAGLVQAADGSLAAAAEIFSADRLAQDLGETELERARCALIAGQVQSSLRLPPAPPIGSRRRGSDRWRRDAELPLLQGDLARRAPWAPPDRNRALRLPPRVRARGRAAAGADRRTHRGRGAPVRGRARIGDTRRCGASRHRRVATRSRPGCMRAMCGHVSSGHRTPVGRQPAGPARACRPCGVPGELRQHRSRHRGRCTAVDWPISICPSRLIPDAPSASSSRPSGPGQWRAGCRRSVRPTTRRPRSCSPTCGRRSKALRQADQQHQPDGALVERRHELEARIAARGWSRAGGGVVRDVVEVDEVRAVLGDATLVRTRGPTTCCTRWWSIPRAPAGRPRRCRRRRRAGAPRARRPRRPRPTSPSGAVAQRRLGVVRPLARAPGRGVAGPARRHAAPRHRLDRRARPAALGNARLAARRPRRRDPVGHRVARRRDRRPVAISGDRRHCRSRRRPRRGRGCVGCARLGAHARARGRRGRGHLGGVHRRDVTGEGRPRGSAWGAPDREPAALVRPARRRPAVRARTRPDTRTPEHVVLSACELGLLQCDPATRRSG